MQDTNDRSTPTSPAERDMLDSFHGGTPSPTGNPAAAEAANAIQPAVDHAANPDR